MILIIGVLAGGALAVALPLLAQAQHRATLANMDRIVDVISAYAQRNQRIPCPANPDSLTATELFGTEAGSGTSGVLPGDCDNPAAGERIEGIVPFRTLGMAAEDIRDGYGRFITYAVSPAFARDTTASLGAHKRCRVEGVWVQAGDSRSPAKARFCCPDITVAPDTDLVVNDQNGRPLWPFVRDDNAGSYDAVDIAFASGTTFDLATESTTAIAFVLVSHGQNGFGAYLQTGGRLSSAGAPVGAGEDENRDTDNVFVAGPRETSFDDLVIWRTQDQVYAETGAASCAFP